MQASAFLILSQTYSAGWVTLGCSCPRSQLSAAKNEYTLPQWSFGLKIAQAVRVGVGSV